MFTFAMMPQSLCVNFMAYLFLDKTTEHNLCIRREVSCHLNVCSWVGFVHEGKMRELNTNGQYFLTKV